MQLVFLLVVFALSAVALPQTRKQRVLISRAKFGSLRDTDTSLFSSKPSKGIDEAYFNRPGPWDCKDLGTLLDANKAWANRMTVTQPNFFEEIKRGHAPKILWIGCSDARVPANEIIGEPPGSVFVHRNIANQVPNTDVSCMSVLQYAIDILKVRHIVVCGHYDCGGIRAATERVDYRAPLDNWLRNIRDTYRLHQKELDSITDMSKRQRRLVELNVIEQCLNVFKTATVQRRRVQTHGLVGKTGSPFTFTEPRVHAIVYEPTTGIVTKLPVDFSQYMKELRSVYDLYSLDEHKSDSTKKQ
jgi:carbonic anhydrase